MIDKKQPLVTIIVPSYNHEQYIEECLDQVIKIDIQKKIIIIDDGSTDKTSEVIKNFINNHQNENIEFVQKTNSGLISSLNLGLEKTQTEYLYLIASDDIPNPSGIKQAIKYLIKHPNIDFFIGGGENFFEDGKRTKIYKQKHTDFFSLNFEARAKEIFLDYPSPLLLQSTIFRTDILKKIGGWDKSIILDDFPMFVKLLRDEDIQFIFNPSIETVLYRHHGVNTYKNIAKQFMMVNQALEKLAPMDLKDRAIGNVLGYYTLKALYQLNLKTVYRLLHISPIKSYFYAIIKIVNIIVNKVIK